MYDRLNNQSRCTISLLANNFFLNPPRPYILMVCKTCPVPSKYCKDPLKRTNVLSHACRDHLNPRDWNCEKVLEWLEHEVHLPEYRRNFAKAKVNGAMLLQIKEESNDLENLLDVTHPLHRRKILMAINRIQERELVDFGIKFDELDEYIAKLDRERITLVARLKSAFDAIDEDRTGLLKAKEVKQVISRLVDSGRGFAELDSEDIREWLQDLDDRDKSLGFPEFVDAVTAFAFKEEGGAAKEESQSSPGGRDKPKMATNKKHVRLSERVPKASQTASKKGNFVSLEDIARDMHKDQEEVEEGEKSDDGGTDRDQTQEDRAGLRKENISDMSSEWDSLTKVIHES